MDLNNRGVPRSAAARTASTARRRTGPVSAPRRRRRAVPGLRLPARHQPAGIRRPTGPGWSPGHAAQRDPRAATLATSSQLLHHPQETGATPVLHMDIKPSNVMVLATGEVRLIDFTGARYWRPGGDHPDRLHARVRRPRGLRRGVLRRAPPTTCTASARSPTSWSPATTRATGHLRHVAPGEASPPPWYVLRRHPMLEQVPTLRDHLHRRSPTGRRTARTPASCSQWLARLADLVRRSGVPDVGVDWAEPEHNESAGHRPRPARPVARVPRPTRSSGSSAWSGSSSSCARPSAKIFGYPRERRPGDRPGVRCRSGVRCRLAVRCRPGVGCRLRVRGRPRVGCRPGVRERCAVGHPGGRRRPLGGPARTRVAPDPAGDVARCGRRPGRRTVRRRPRRPHRPRVRPGVHAAGYRPASRPPRRRRAGTAADPGRASVRPPKRVDPTDALIQPAEERTPWRNAPAGVRRTQARLGADRDRAPPSRSSAGVSGRPVPGVALPPRCSPSRSYCGRRGRVH